MIKDQIYKTPICNKKGVVIRELYKYPTNPPIYVEKCIASQRVRRILVGPAEEKLPKINLTSKIKEIFLKLIKL